MLLYIHYAKYTKREGNIWCSLFPDPFFPSMVEETFWTVSRLFQSLYGMLLIFFQDMDVFSLLDKFHRQDLEDNMMQRLQIYCTSELRNLIVFSFDGYDKAKLTVDDLMTSRPVQRFLHWKLFLCRIF